MHPQSWLEHLGRPWQVRILRLLARDPTRLWTGREVAKALEASPNTVNLALKALRDAGFLEFRQIGRSHAIRLQQSAPQIERMRRLFELEAQALVEVRAAIRAATPRGVTSILYGSTV